MNKLIKITCLIAAAFLIACSSGDQQNESNANGSTESATEESSIVNGNYTVDLDQSTINWVGKKTIGNKHVGTIDLSEGSLTVSEGSISGGTFIIDMNSITNTDGMPDEDRAKLEGHLKSPDFFDVAAHPSATFSITSVSELTEGDGTHQVTGELTLKGISNSISFPANIEFNNNSLSASATMSFDRSKFEVRFGSTKFFTDLVKDAVISDMIDLKIDLAASAN